MANFGQAALTIVGTVIGTFFGVPQLGYVLGSLAGQALFPTQLNPASGPRLSDLKTTSSSVGGPVHELFGTDCVPGTVIYLGPMQEVSTTDEVGGKGGPQQEVTTFTYYQTLAIGLVRGPRNDVLRIWENGKLVYDARPQLVGESDVLFGKRVLANDAYAVNFVLYTGDAIQLPDPTIESERDGTSLGASGQGIGGGPFSDIIDDLADDLIGQGHFGTPGVDDTPAFRGLMYIVYPNRQLLEEQGLRHPTFKFEVSGDTSYEADYIIRITESENSVDIPLRVMAEYGVDLTFDTSFPTVLVDVKPGVLVGSAASNTGGSTDAAFILTGMQARVIFRNRGFIVGRGGDGGSPPGDAFDPGPTAGGYFLPMNGGYALDAGSGNLLLIDNKNGIIAGGGGGGASAGLSDAASGGGVFYREYASGGGGAGMIPGRGGDNHNFGFFDSDGGTAGAPPTFPGSGGGPVLASTGGGDFTVAAGDGGGLGLGGGNFAVAEGIENTGGYFEDKGVSDPGYSIWSDTDSRAVILIEGIIIGPQQLGNGSLFPSSIIPDTTSGGAVLADIVREVCLRVGVTDIDVSDLEALTVPGYVISRVMTAADAIEPLRKAGFFDYVEDGTTLKFVTRGKAAVRTLTTDDLGATDTDSQAPAVVTRMQQDVDLPRQIRVHFRNPDRDYEDDEELSPSRLITDSVNDVDLELPMSLSREQAAQIAEVLWADAWASRFAHTFSLDYSHTDLEPADVLLLPVDNELQRVRIVSIDDAAFLIRKMEALRDDDGNYEPVAVGASIQHNTNILQFISTTMLEFLDLPPLRTIDTDAGIYVAVRSAATGNTWRGAAIYRSLDNGSSLDQLVAVTSGATIGSLVSSLPVGVLPGGSPTLDEVHVITVDLVSGGFESRPESEVTNSGANTLAIGVKGRWLIVGFCKATQISAARWELSRLVWGRRGTEYLIGTPLAGDKVVVISGSGITRVPLDPLLIGTELLYRAVSIGSDFADGTEFDYAGNGQALVPFSPKNFVANIVGAGIQLSWTRRDRLGQELTGFVDPISDPPLTFQVDVLATGSPTIVVRTITVTAETALYTNAQIIADFGVLPSQALVKIYQISPTVGRGIPLDGTITFGIGGSTTLTFAATGRAKRYGNMRGSTSLSFTPTGSIDNVNFEGDFIMIAGITTPPDGTFGFYRLDGPPEQGSIIVGDPDDVGGLGLRLEALYWGDDETFQISISNGTLTGDGPDQDVITSITVVTEFGLRTFITASADTFGANFNGGYSFWTWNGETNQLFNDGNDYDFTITV